MIGKANHCHQKQNFAEREWEDKKMLANKILNIFRPHFYEELGKFAPTQGYLISVQQECKSFLAVADLSSSTEIQKMMLHFIVGIIDMNRMLRSGSDVTIETKACESTRSMARVHFF